MTTPHLMIFYYPHSLQRRTGRGGGVINVFSMSCLRAEEREGDLKGNCYSCLRVSIHYQYKILLSSCVMTIYNSNIVDRDTK